MTVAAPGAGPTPRKARAPKRPAPPPPVDLVVYRRRPVEPYIRDGQAIGWLGELDEAILPAPGWRGWDRYPIRWALVEADALIPSHDPATWRKRPDYPAGVQERDYGPQTRERIKVESQIATFEPRLMLADSPSVIDGPPLVTRSGVVLGGNSRTMTVQAIYAQSAARAQAARDALLGYLGRSKVHGDFGRESVAAMARPVLVRVLQLPDAQQADPALLRDLAARANQPLTQALDPRRSASSAAARLDPEAVRAIGDSADPEESVSEWLAGPGGVAVLGALRQAGVINNRNEASWVGADGRLHAEGRLAVLRVLAASVVTDPELLDALPTSLMDELAAGAAPILGAASYGHDVAPALQAAIRYWSAWKRTGKTLALYQGQTGWEGAEWGEAPKLAGELEQACFTALQDHRGVRRFPALWRRFALLAQRWAPGADLFQDRTTLELLREALGETPERKTNPASERWDRLTDEAAPDHLVEGPWTVPARKPGALAMEQVRDLKPIPLVVVAWQRDPLGQLVPVGRYRWPDGRKLADPRIRLVNPSLPMDARAYSLLAALKTKGGPLGPVLGWLEGGQEQPSDRAWSAARRYLREWAEAGDYRAPWGVAATCHLGAGGLLRAVDAWGWSLELDGDRATWARMKGPRPTNRQGPGGQRSIPTLNNPARTPREYFLRQLKHAQEPWRSPLVAISTEAGDSAEKVPGLVALAKLCRTHQDTRDPLWGWGVPASAELVTGTVGRDQTWRVTDAAGYGLEIMPNRRRARWFGPPQEEPQE